MTATQIAPPAPPLTLGTMDGDFLSELSVPQPPAQAA